MFVGSSSVMYSSTCMRVQKGGSTCCCHDSPYCCSDTCCQRPRWHTIPTRSGGPGFLVSGKSGGIIREGFSKGMVASFLTYLLTKKIAPGDLFGVCVRVNRKDTKTKPWWVKLCWYIFVEVWGYGLLACTCFAKIARNKQQSAIKPQPTPHTTSIHDQTTYTYIPIPYQLTDRSMPSRKNPDLSPTTLASIDTSSYVAESMK